MSSFRKLAWAVYRVTEWLIRATGLRRYEFGKALVAIANRAGGLLLKRFSHASGSIIETHGQKMYLPGQHSAGVALTMRLLNDHYEPETTALFKTLLRPGSTMVDVGAHIGYYSLLAARLVGPQGKVYAFEPDPDNFGALEKNLALNGIRNVLAFPQAVADRTARLRLFRDNHSSDRHSLLPTSTDSSKRQSIEVQATSMDDFMASRGWPLVDLIKIDIEGAEPMAIAGMRRTLQQAGTDNVILEFGPGLFQSPGISPEDFLRQLTAFGFSISPVEEKGTLRALEACEFGAFIDGLKLRGGANLLCRRVSAGRSIIPHVLWSESAGGGQRHVR